MSTITLTADDPKWLQAISDKIFDNLLNNMGSIGTVSNITANLNKLTNMLNIDYYVKIPVPVKYIKVDVKVNAPIG